MRIVVNVIAVFCFITTLTPARSLLPVSQETLQVGAVRLKHQRSRTVLFGTIGAQVSCAGTGLNAAETSERFTD